MVASTNAEVYAPFTRVPVIEEGFQSSEEGSELHSPIYDGSYTPDEFPYQLSQLMPYGVDPQLYLSTWDGHYDASSMNAQLRDSLLLHGVQVPSSSVDHDLPHSLSHAPPLHEHAAPDLDSPGRFQPNVLAPTSDWPFNLPHSRLPEPHFRTTHDMLHDADPPYGYHNASSVSSSEQTPEITLPSGTKHNSSSTTNGNARPPRREASTVVIACRQCRARKIRCDSTRPVCHNCTRRNNECEYDAVPKRRGPDKRPGTRQRSCKKRPADATAPPAKKKRRATDETTDSFDLKIKEASDTDTKPLSVSLATMHDGNSHFSHSVPGNTTHGHESDVRFSRDGFHHSSHRHHTLPKDYPDSHGIHKSFTRPIDINFHRHQHDDHNKAIFIPLSPSVEYNRKSWWDNLLREHSLRDILTDLHFLFNSSSYWLSFIHIPTFFRDLQDVELRVRMQPALIMSALAMATLMRSSELEHGAEGRTRALYYRDTAQALLEAACNSQSVDYTLAEAALIIALFESSCHPQYTSERATCSLQFLDRIIQVLSLCSVDAHDPDASRFSQSSAPSVYLPENYRPPKKCCCIVSHQSSPHLDGYHSSTSMHPAWNPNWSDAEIRKEECRRLCWIALALIANYTFQCSAFHQEPLQFVLSDPSNYALLFPGEAYERALNHEHLYGQSTKDSLWAVYCRSMLLWSSCIRQPDERWSTDHRVRYAMDILAETRSVQAALDMHQCNVDGTLLNVCKEFLYHTRLTVTYDLRRLQEVDSAGGFDRRQAEEWLYYQEQIAKGIKAAVLQLGEAPGHLLSRRPFQVNWISSQVMICLALWNYDRSLVHALDLGKTFLIPLDVLNALWPSSAQRSRRDELRHRLEEACASARLPPPLPAELTLPPILRP